jgi:hypothetical protein
MTEEEIRPIAENYVEEYCHCSDGEYTDGSLVCAGIGTALIVSRQLEKRIAELEHQLTHRNCLDCSNHSSKLRMRTLELEKENAELRKDKKELCHSISEGGKACVYLNEQLTKAKEIIKNLIVYVPVDLKEYEEAKQFLSENSTYERIQKAKYNYVD